MSSDTDLPRSVSTVICHLNLARPGQGYRLATQLFIPYVDIMVCSVATPRLSREQQRTRSQEKAIQKF